MFGKDKKAPKDQKADAQAAPKTDAKVDQKNRSCKKN